MLFKSLNSKSDQNAKDIIGCLGKLPIQAELIRCNVNNANLKLVENWLQESFAHVSREQLIRNQNSTNFKLAHGLLLNYGIGRKPIIATLHDSVDACGRTYPLILFQELNDLALLNYQHHIPLLYQAIYEAFSNLSRQSWLGKNAHDFIEQLLANQTSVLRSDQKNMQRSIHQLYSAIEYYHWWQQIMPNQNFQHANKLLSTVLKTAKNLSTQGVWQINLPIAKSEFMFISIGFWLSLLQAIGALHYRNMHLAWSLTNNAEQINLTIYHGNLSIAFFRSLLNKEDARLVQLNPQLGYLENTDLTMQFEADINLQQIIDTINIKYKNSKLAGVK